MGKIAFVLSGQGAQYPGMGKSFYETYPEIKNLFDAAERLRPGTLNQCFYGTEEELRNTANTQPCLYLTDLAAAIALTKEGVKPDGVAGFSLGEIPALAYGGAYSFEDGFRIACIRGREMSRADPAAMVAVLKLEDDTVRAAAEELDGAWAVNFNAPGQVVVSCRAEKLEAVTEKMKALGGRVLPLKLGGGFHSPLMAEPARRFADALMDFEMVPPNLPVYRDRTATVYEDEPSRELPLQIVSPVLWTDLIRNMAADGFDTFVELGAGNTLTGFVKRILPEARAYTINDADDVKEIAGEWKYV